jgi:hypothetical protein
VIDLTIQRRISINAVFYEDRYSSFVPRSFMLEYTIQALPDANINGENLHLSQIITVNKCDLFVEDYVDGAIVTDNNGLPFLKDLISAGSDNNMMAIPYITDACFLATLFSKLNVLCSTGMVVSSAKLADLRTDTAIIVQGTSPAKGLPESSKWVGNFPYWPEPWWTRHDITTYDNYAESIEELEEWQERFAEDNIPGQSAAPLVEIEAQIRAAFDDVQDSEEIINLGTLH